jgi:hypothetical protein
MGAKQLRFSDESSLDAAATYGSDELTALRRGDLATTVDHFADRSRARIDLDPQQLENRFHEDFRTVGYALRSASEVVVGILTRLLLPSTGVGFGLGVSPGAITSRGTRSAQDYLDFLIGLSDESATELEHRYRLDLSRSDAIRPRAVPRRPRHDRRAHRSQQVPGARPLLPVLRRVAEAAAQVPWRELPRTPQHAWSSSPGRKRSALRPDEGGCLNP